MPREAERARVQPLDVCQVELLHTIYNACYTITSLAEILLGAFGPWVGCPHTLADVII